MSTRLTPAEINRVGEALVGGDLVTELELIVAERTRFHAETVSELAAMNAWSNSLADLIPDGDESKFSNPEGAQESIVLECLTAYVAQRAAIQALRDRLWSSSVPIVRSIAIDIQSILDGNTGATVTQASRCPSFSPDGRQCHGDTEHRHPQTGELTSHWAGARRVWDLDGTWLAGGPS